MSILTRIITAKRAHVDECRRARPEAELLARLPELPAPRDFRGSLQRGEATWPRVIAEFKRASPSAGPICSDAQIEDIAVRYETAGAAAISVLTDREFFDGDLSFLGRAREAVSLPLLRKDFVCSTYQIVEARVEGADAVLLIVAALSDVELDAFLKCAHEVGLATLVEVHTEEEAARAVAVGADIIGVNHRDLHTFEIDLTLTERLRKSVPEELVLVGESGIRGTDDVRRLADAGADAILVGEHLMRSADPARALRELLGGDV